MALATGGDLSPKDNMKFEEHLIKCHACRDSYSELQRSLKLARSLIGQETSVEFKSTEWQRIVHRAISQGITEGHSVPLGLPQWVRGVSVGLLILVALASGVMFIRQKHRPKVPEQADVLLKEGPAKSDSLYSRIPKVITKTEEGKPIQAAAKHKVEAKKPAGTSWLTTSLGFQHKGVSSITYTSLETGLTVHWYVNERFNYGEVRK
jgi:hypothetical protein